jgi:hypothetical protein
LALTGDISSLAYCCHNGQTLVSLAGDDECHHQLLINAPVAAPAREMEKAVTAAAGLI